MEIDTLSSNKNYLPITYRQEIISPPTDKKGKLQGIIQKSEKPIEKIKS